MSIALVKPLPADLVYFGQQDLTSLREDTRNLVKLGYLFRSKMVLNLFRHI